MTNKITPCLWFNDNIEEAVNFYVEVFKDAEIRRVDRYPDGRVLTMMFRLHNQEYMALNGGDMYKFTPAVSFMVDCKDQAETDHFWDRLLEGGGRPDQCGWLQDRFGLSWQIVPEALPRLLGQKDRAAAGRAMEAMFKMQKIVIADLEAASAAA